jgi:hypothetical protein
MKTKSLPILLVIFCSCSVAQTSDSASARLACQSNPTAAQLIVTHADIPLYPPLAVEAHLQGTVVFHLVVKKGVATKIAMEAPLGVSGLLRDAAVENVRTWRFASISNGKADATFIYELKGEESEALENPRVEMELPACVIVTSRPRKPIMDDIILKKPK